MSEDTFTEVSEQSWFSRIGGAFKGIVAGLVLLAIAFFLLFWNEGRAVKRYKSLKEGGGVVISVLADRVDSSHQGKLVHVSAMANSDETLNDTVFGVSRKAIKLRRSVQMYQWKEKRSSEEKKKLGGGTTTKTTYSYEKVWSDSLISSSSFKKQNDHHNPSKMAYSSSEAVASQVHFGAFMLSPSLVGKISRYTPVSLDSDYQLPDTLTSPATVSEENTLFLGEDPANPQVGDMRISFSEVLPMSVSVVAKQVNKSFTPYLTKVGGSVELLQVGNHTAEEMFATAQQSNTILTWILRVVGLILMFMGGKLILAPLAVLADVVPLFGNIVGAGTTLIAGLSSVLFSLLTIAVAWIIYRPLIGLTLLAIAVGTGVLLVIKLRKTPTAKDNSEQNAAVPPPLS